ncbi:MAG TPA: hypothetical protein VJH71_01595 [Candidatus Paceibacterota bacterium]
MDNNKPGPRRLLGSISIVFLALLITDTSSKIWVSHLDKDWAVYWMVICYAGFITSSLYAKSLMIYGASSPASIVAIVFLSATMVFSYFTTVTISIPSELRYGNTLFRIDILALAWCDFFNLLLPDNKN